MAVVGQKISQMTPVATLENNDLFPMVRGNDNFVTLGVALASRSDMLTLSALSVTGLNQKITKPSVAAGGQLLTFNATTQTWVASGSPVSLPAGNSHGQILLFNNTTKTWVPSSVKLESDGVPIGSIIMYPVSAIPAGWFECRGQEISKTAYADLWNLLGTRYGTASNTNNFKLPDLRGEFVRGWDNSRLVDVGRVLGSTQTGSLSLPPFFVTSVRPDDATTTSPLSVYAPAQSNPNYPFVAQSFSGSETRPRNVAMVFCIKYATASNLNSVGLSVDSILNTINSLSAFSLGVNQTWGDYTSSRGMNIWYTNTTGKPIAVQVYYISLIGIGGSSLASLRAIGSASDITIYGSYTEGGVSSNNLYFIVPPNWQYRVNMPSTPTNWVELR